MGWASSTETRFSKSWMVFCSWALSSSILARWRALKAYSSAWKRIAETKGNCHRKALYWKPHVCSAPETRARILQLLTPPTELFVKTCEHMKWVFIASLTCGMRVRGQGTGRPGCWISEFIVDKVSFLHFRALWTNTERHRGERCHQ